MRSINSEFLVGNAISSGTFGLVYEGLHKPSKTKIAVKKEIGSKQTIPEERKVLQLLQGIQGVPKLFFNATKFENRNILVLEYLESDLSALKQQYFRFTLKTVLQIALQVISILEQIHRRNIIHRDLKPENIMIKNLTQSQIYIIDYGISKPYIKNGQFIPFRKDKKFVGTNKYASVASHNGLEQSPKDDIESLLYIIKDLYDGDLPWMNSISQTVIGKMKEQCTGKTLFGEMPVQLSQIYDYNRKISFYQMPNYSKIVNDLQTIASNHNIKIDETFDWTKQTLTLLGSFSQIAATMTDKQYWINESQCNYISSDEEESIEDKYKKCLKFSKPFL